MATIEQQIAQAEAELARLRERKRAEENGQKIILGGMLLASARHDAKIAAWLIKEAEKAVTRDIDKKRLAPLLEELRPVRLAEGVSESQHKAKPGENDAR
jgi:hypothetical protein